MRQGLFGPHTSKPTTYGAFYVYDFFASSQHPSMQLLLSSCRTPSQELLLQPVMSQQISPSCTLFTVWGDSLRGSRTPVDLGGHMLQKPAHLKLEAKQRHVTGKPSLTLLPHSIQSLLNPRTNGQRPFCPQSRWTQRTPGPSGGHRDAPARTPSGCPGCPALGRGQHTTSSRQLPYSSISFCFVCF